MATFFVDIPCSVHPDAPWEQIAAFSSKEEAVKFCKEIFGRMIMGA